MRNSRRGLLRPAAVTLGSVNGRLFAARRHARPSGSTFVQASRTIFCAPVRGFRKIFA
jgi:hypothetical protein